MSTKRSPRAMPVETIVTRYKSRNRQIVNERHKNVTKPISPKSKPITKPVKQYAQKPKSKDVQKSSVKTNEDNDREFYPDRPRRNIQYKKVVLMPKHSMKMIGGTKSCNKRKLHMPQKETKRTRHNSTTSTLSDNEPKPPEHKDQDAELTIKDMVLLIEEEGGLDDEDLLEILTCPSPVWWEDPPNGYIEELIFARPKPAEQKSIKNQLLEEQSKEAERRKRRDEESTLKAKDTENLDVSKLGISIENRGVNFINRRCKLESLLGSIRNKVKVGNVSFKQGNKNIADDLNANNNGKNDKNDVCDSNKSQSTESKQKTVKVNGDNGSIKEGYKNVADDLNANHNGKNVIICDSKKSQSTEAKQATIKVKGDNNSIQEGRKNVADDLNANSNGKNVIVGDSKKSQSTEAKQESIIVIEDNDSNQEGRKNVADDLNANSYGKNDKNVIVCDSDNSQSTESKQKTIKVNGDNDSIKEGYKNVADDLNANHNGKNVIICDSKKSQSTEAKQETIKVKGDNDSIQEGRKNVADVLNVNNNGKNVIVGDSKKNQSTEAKQESIIVIEDNDSNQEGRKNVADDLNANSYGKNDKNVIVCDSNKSQSTESKQETIIVIGDNDSSKEAYKNVADDLDANSNGKNDKNVIVCDSNKSQSTESKQKTIKVKRDNDSSKEGYKNVADDLNVSNNGKNVVCDSNKSQSTESKQKNIGEIVNAESNIKKTQKCVTKIVCNTDKNQRVELKPKNNETCSKCDKNETNNQPSEPLEMKIIKYRNKKVHKTERWYSVLTLKEVVNINDNSANENQNLKFTESKNDKNWDKSNISHKDITKANEEKRSPELFEEDLLDLEDHELLSLENIEIPIASNNTTTPTKISKAPEKRNEIIGYQTKATKNSFIKSSGIIADNHLGIKLNSFNTEKETKKIEKEFSENKLKPGEIIDIHTSNSKKEQENTNNRVKEIDRDIPIENKFSYIRVKKIETITILNSNCSNDGIHNKILANNDDAKNTTPSEKDISLNYTTSAKSVEKFPSDSFRLSDRNSDKPNLVKDREDACIKNTEFTNCLSAIKTLAPTQKAFSQIQDSDNLNNHISQNHNSSLKIKTISGNDFSNQVENKITGNQDKNINSARRCSIDSGTSDKNMSVEYLDMSLLDEDERKIELESQNNEFIYESDDYQSQSGGQSCNKKSHINFKSDLDMTDTNMYEQINESCNNDIIKYIRDNQKDIDTNQDEDTADSDNFIEDFVIDNTFRSSSPIHKNAISNKLSQEKDNLDGDEETEYVAVYKVISSDSENECNSTKINEVKSVVLNETNEVNITKLNEIKENATNSELITYEEEYLTEFDEIESVGSEKEGNSIKSVKVDDVTLNVSNGVNLKNLNEVKSVVTENIHNNPRSLLKTNKGIAIDKTNNKGDLTEMNKSLDVGVKAESSKTTDKTNKRNINSYFKHQKDVRKSNKISNNKLKKENHGNCKSCKYKNKSILISENETIKYCLLCSSIYDTDNCRYCINKSKEECSCKGFDEYVCDKCNIKVRDKEAIIEHLKQNCNTTKHTNP